MVKGSVDKVIERQTKAGVFHSVCVNEVWYGTGKTKPICKEGDIVEFEETKNSKGYAEVVEGSLKVVPVQAAQSGTVGGAIMSSTGSAGKQLSIEYQSARRDALTALDLAIRLGIELPIPTEGRGAKKVVSLSGLTALVDMMAGEFLRLSTDAEHVASLISGDDDDVNPNPNEGDDFAE